MTMPLYHERRPTRSRRVAWAAPVPCALQRRETVSEETPTPVTSPVCKLPAGSRFTIVVDGVTVEGEVTSRWSRDIAVKLVSPIGHVGASCSVPYFAAHITNYDTI